MVQMTCWRTGSEKPIFVSRLPTRASGNLGRSTVAIADQLLRMPSLGYRERIIRMGQTRTCALSCCFVAFSLASLAARFASTFLRRSGDMACTTEVDRSVDQSKASTADDRLPAELKAAVDEPYLVRMALSRQSRCTWQQRCVGDREGCMGRLTA